MVRRVSLNESGSMPVQLNRHARGRVAGEAGSSGCASANCSKQDWMTLRLPSTSQDQPLGDWNMGDRSVSRSFRKQRHSVYAMVGAMILAFTMVSPAWSDGKQPAPHPATKVAFTGALYHYQPSPFRLRQARKLGQTAGGPR